MHAVGPTLENAWSDFFYISRRLIIKLIRSKSLFLWYSFTFNVVITHEILTFQNICIDEIPKDFTSIKDTYYAALKVDLHIKWNREVFIWKVWNYVCVLVIFKISSSVLLFYSIEVNYML